MVEPWAKAGYQCFLLDIQHPKGVTAHPDMPNVWRIGADILNWIPPMEDYRMAFSFAPCDDMAVSGARRFAGKGLHAPEKSIMMFGRGVEICEWTKAPWMAEHPVSTISSYFRKPDHTFHPHEYDYYIRDFNNYPKIICIWKSNIFLYLTG